MLDNIIFLLNGTFKCEKKYYKNQRERQRVSEDSLK